MSSLGHAHPAIVEAVVERRSARLAHTSNLVMHEPGVRLAERLVELLGLPGAGVLRQQRRRGERGGAQARAQAPARAARSSSCTNSFHGRTMGALSVTGNAAKREPFAPLPGPVTFVDYGDVEALRAAVDDEHRGRRSSSRPSARAASSPPPAGYLAAVRAICDAAGALMIVDEVQWGIGRTGHWFASQAEGVRPDVLTLAKGLGGGLPIGACLGIGAAGELFAPGDHGSTFGGNPVSAAAALAVLATIEADGLLDSVKTRRRAPRRTASRRSDSPLVAGVRGTGLWRGVGLTGPHAPAVEAAARAPRPARQRRPARRAAPRPAADPHRGRGRRGAAVARRRARRGRRT